jgi:hypothetical protein
MVTERQQVEIDYCPQCRGVWLDRGELDKIIERTGNYREIPPARALDRDDDRYRSEDRDKYRDDRYRDDDDYKKKRKKSFLDDLFDF